MDDEYRSEKEEEGTDRLQDADVKMAFMDALPVAFFAAGSAVIARRFHNRLFRCGAALAALSGSLKVLWKFLLLAKKKDIPLLNRQMKYGMHAGFSLMSAGVFEDWKKIPVRRLLRTAAGMPQGLFFLGGCAGMGFMTYFAKNMDHGKASSNWLEQTVNTAAQGAFLAGTILTARKMVK